MQLKDGDVLIYEVTNNGQVDSVIASVRQRGDSTFIEYQNNPPTQCPTNILLSKNNFDLIARGRRAKLTEATHIGQVFMPQGTVTQKVNYKGTRNNCYYIQSS